MTERLLHIEASPRGERSRSSRVAAALIEALPGVSVETLNPFSADLPQFDGAVMEARYDLIAGQELPEAVAGQWRAIEGHIDRLLSFDTWVISTPMWNFSVPYPLKHYIDVVTQPGMLFQADATGVTGLAKGRTVVLIGSGALDIDWRNGDPLDHQMRFLTTWLGFIGVEDIRTVDLRPTYGAPDDVEAETQRAIEAARRLATEL